MLPALATPDSSIDLLREGYTFISRHCDDLGTDGFRTRLRLRPVTCIRGAEAAGMFYRGDRFTRQGAFPASIVHLLQDKGSVQALAGEEHRHRKDMFLQSLQGPDPRDLPQVFEQQWYAALDRWVSQRQVVLHTELLEMLTRTGAAWCGIPLDEQDVQRRSTELGAMVQHAGSFGPPNWWARTLRRRSERWARRLVDEVRSGSLHAPDDGFLSVVATHHDLEGRVLDPGVAAVELLNVLRPIVAVGRFITFTALALLSNPQWHEAFSGGDESDLLGFVQEVRRLYPFFPLIGGRARETFEWRGHRFGTDDWVLLDLYGTNHDSRVWQDPYAFAPQRFRDWSGDPDTLVPQGAGEYETGHRCPGEPATIELMAQAVRLLTRGMHYQVPVQDFTVSMRAMPSLPKDGFIMHEVRAAHS